MWPGDPGMDIDPSKLRTREVYALLTSLIVPRAIGFTSTKDARGRLNVAPFSYFTGLGSDPPLVTLGIANKRDGSPKDTLRALSETSVLCVNLVEEPIVAPMNQASGEYAADVSEFEVTGLTPAPCAVIDCVRVRESRASLECRVVDVHRYGRGAGVNLVVAEVVHVFLDDDIVCEGMAVVDPEKIRPVARLGGTGYAKLGEIFHLERPKV